MNNQTLGTLFLAMSLLPACGDQLVEFELADGNNSTEPDGMTDGSGSNSSSAPMVTATTPINTAVNVGVTRRVTATFSKSMNPSTLTATTFIVKQGTTTITGVVTYTAATATFVPNSPLSLSKQYTATITTGATDAQGRSLASNYNHTSRPPVVAVAGGQSRVLVRRETEDDLMRLDLG